jgi:hypothetical protein
MRPDLEPLDESNWPRRLTIAGYVIAAVIVILTVIHVINVPG